MVPAVEAQARYGWVETVLRGVVQRPATRVVTLSDRVDRVLTNKLWGMLIFVAAMLLVFSSVFVAAEPLMRAIDTVIGTIGETVADLDAARAPVHSLDLVDGVRIGGVGLCVLVFCRRS